MRSFRQFSRVKSTFLASETKIYKADAPKPHFSEDQPLVFGAIPTPHMLEIDYYGNSGWEAPVIKPFAPLSIHPFNSSLHYAIQCFEGMKAYKDPKNKIRFFRPQLNMERFLVSSKRLGLPEFDTNELFKCIEQYIKLEKDWIPELEGSSLYIRPLHISNTNKLGVHKAKDSKILVMASPAQEYFKKNSRGLWLDVNENYWRGTPHSVSQYKLGCNYAPTITITSETAHEGYEQAIWTFNENMLESGATNLFFLLQKDGKQTLVTHPLDGSILPGITRRSIIELAKDVVPDIKVEERSFSISEFIDCYNKKQIKEVFVAGTAAVTGGVSRLRIRGTVYELPYGEVPNYFSTTFKKMIYNIQYGKIDHPFSVVCE